MTTADVKKETTKKSSDVSTFLSNLNSAIDSRASSTDAQENTINRFYYSIGSLNFLLEQKLKVENISPNSISKVPHTQTWYKGIISIRGTIMPVISMHEFLKNRIDYKETNTNKESHLISINHAEFTPIALLIDKLPETVDITTYKTKKAPENSPRWFENTLEKENNLIINVNHKSLLEQIAKQ